MDKWDKLNEPLTEDEIQELVHDMGCADCEDEWGTTRCYTCVLLWAMNKIQSSDTTARELDE